MASAENPATRKRLALAIIDYLNTCVTDGTLPPDDRDSIDVATNCIADAFKVDPTDTAAISDALGQNQNLLKIYSVYEKLRGTNTPSTQSSSSKDTAASASSASSATSTTAEKSAEAEGLKGQGNVAMQKKDYAKAIEFYSKAIEISPTNPIFLSNRAAAYSATQKHDLARQDAEMAVAADPKYTKAWSRLGLARYALGDAKGSMEAYKAGIDAEGSGGSEAMKKGYETAKRKVDELEQDEPAARSGSPGAGAGAGGMPDLAGLASMLGGGAGGGAGGGGMPDLAGLMNNPMMRQMAQNLMSNPDMMNNLMNNPRLRDMANQYGSGEGMPDFGSMMNDPSIAEMARSFMGGGGAGPGAGAGSGAGGHA